MRFMLFAMLFCLGCSPSVLAEPAAVSDQPFELSHPRKWQLGWTKVSPEQRRLIVDDDIQRHADDEGYWDGIAIEERKFREAGFDWHLIRFSSVEKPESVVWLVPHDDENGAFEGMIAAIKKHGGVGIAVNSGPGSLRRQAGDGFCGGRPGRVKSCDPNRNFSDTTPQFTSAFLDHWTDAQQPVIALHTNGPGAAGDFSLLDIAAYRQGQTRLRPGAYRAENPVPLMDNYDTLGLIAYLEREGGPRPVDVACRKALNTAGIHFWHEAVGKSDGSLSNYLALQRPEIRYFNAESRSETDLALAASRHMIMIDAYLKYCIALRDKPATGPTLR